MTIKNNYCVILAGGKGRRLWPSSREQYPKQFVDFLGKGRTQLQQTYDRFVKILPKDHIYISTNQTYLHLVQEQLPELLSDNILAEPIYRNTAPSVAWAVHRIMHIDKDANLIVTPSDQDVYNEDAFCTNVKDGLEFVENHDALLTMGVKPTRAEPGYGYIQLGNPAGHDVYKVQSFTEKPERNFAKVFVESGEFYWNTGLFLSNVRYLQHCFTTLLPVVLQNLDEINPNWTVEEENEFIRDNFPSYPNISMDYGVLEKSEHVYVMKCDFGWADLGTWHSIYETMRKSEADNVVVNSDVIIDDSRNNIIRLPKGKLAVINGLDGFIVAEEGDMLLICKKEDSSALIRKYVNEVQMKKGEEFV